MKLTHSEVKALSPLKASGANERISLLLKSLKRKKKRTLSLAILDASLGTALQTIVNESLIVLALDSYR